MKKWQKAIVCLLVLFLAGFLFMPRDIVRDTTKSVALSKEQLERYDSYQIPVEEITSGEISVIDGLLSLCNYEETVVSGDHTYKTYSSESLKKYIPLCDEITDISKGEDSFLYVSYTTMDNRTVNLIYRDAGLSSRSVRENGSDSCFVEDREKGTASIESGSITTTRYGGLWELVQNLHDLLFPGKG